MSRADIPEEERRDFHLYVDEFQSFATTSFAALLSEARKYRLCLTLAHQYLEQISPQILAAVLGNCGTLIAFRVGASDADRLSPEFAPYPATTLQELSRGKSWCGSCAAARRSSPSWARPCHRLTPMRAVAET